MEISTEIMTHAEACNKFPFIRKLDREDLRQLLLGFAHMALAKDNSLVNAVTAAMLNTAED